MPFIYITGSAGSGKTTLQQELIRLGYEAHDEDDPEIGSAHNKRSNKAVALPSVDRRTKQWFAEHEWRVFPEALKELKKKSANKVIILCGNVATEKQLKELFDAVIFLYLDEATMRERLASRKKNDFGKVEHEVQMILARDKAYKILHGENKSKIIDASKPLEAVLSEVLEIVRR